MIIFIIIIFSSLSSDFLDLLHDLKIDNNHRKYILQKHAGTRYFAAETRH